MRGLPVLCLLALWLACLPLRAEAKPGYALEERIYPSNGAIAQVAWLDNSHYLTLALTPGGTEVYRHTYPTTALPEPFMSAGFFSRHVCRPDLAGRIQWRLSPQKKYLFFGWFDDNGGRQWTLFEISDVPNFKLKRFQPPAGMNIFDVLFSPDDRYAVFIHDSMHGESDVSVLALDLSAGTEAWRLSTQQVNFISDLWWGGAVYNAPRFYAAAKLHDGQFEARHGLVSFDLAANTWQFTSNELDLVRGAEALWGKLTCYAVDAQQAQYVLQVAIPGQELPREIPLTAHPVDLVALPQPGLVLINNTSDYITNQLWLIDVFSGDKYLIDPDCAGFSLAPDGKLLVRARTRIELRVYAPLAEDSEP